MGCGNLTLLAYDISNYLQKPDLNLEYVLAIVLRCFEADACAVYVSKADERTLAFRYPHNGFSFPEKAAKAEEKTEKSASYCYASCHDIFPSMVNDEHDAACCLVLPLIYHSCLEGNLVLVWQEARDESLEDNYMLLDIICSLLVDVLLLKPKQAFFRLQQQRIQDLEMLYHRMEDEIDKREKDVALELHDEVGQSLTSIMLQLEMLSDSNDFDYIKGRLSGLHNIARETLEEVRHMVHNLRPMILDRLGLTAALESHIEGYSLATKIEVVLRCCNLECRFPAEIENVAYRCVQEGLTNVARHSQASQVLINLSNKNQFLLVQVSDNGIGMSEGQKHGFGLMGIAERVRRVNGRFWLSNNEEHGLVIHLLLPLR